MVNLISNTQLLWQKKKGKKNEDSLSGSSIHKLVFAPFLCAFWHRCKWVRTQILLLIHLERPKGETGAITQKCPYRYYKYILTVVVNIHTVLLLMNTNAHVAHVHVGQLGTGFLQLQMQSTMLTMQPYGHVCIKCSNGWPIYSWNYVHIFLEIKPLIFVSLRRN